MRKETIKANDTINTIAGFLTVKSYNGSIVYCDESTTDENGEIESVTERMLTLEEIGHEMKAVDGLNHTVIWGE